MKHTVLLVIDIQRGAFDGERGSPIDRPQHFVENALDLLSAARETGTPVVFVQHCEGAGEPFEENSPHWQFHEALTPGPNDRVLKKYASSAFEGTGLANTLEDLGANELVLCGLQSEFCVFNTAKSALDLGFTVVVAGDGHRTWASNAESAIAISERINRELEARGAKLSSTADLVRSLREVQP